MHSQGLHRSQVVLYVDDMLIAGRDSHALDLLKQSFHASFDMKDLGDVNHTFGMRILRNQLKGLLFLSQQEYVTKVFRHSNQHWERAGGRLEFHCLHM